MRDYQHNKAPKDRDLLKLIRKAIKKDCLRNGFDFEDFANELGLSAGTLDNKLKPSCDVNVLSLDEFIHILDITADYEPLEYIARRYGFRLCRPEGEIEKPTGDLLDYLTQKVFQIVDEMGKLAQKTREAVRDGELSDQERKEIVDLAFHLRKLAAELEQIGP
ncbi:MAG: hypothetical protein GXO16_05790 [Epsilonproteobacteria bacterium]|nr:hypothetical protein [Campylobacterota bacterium]